MRSPFMLLPALIVCLTMASCASSAPPVTAPPKPLPAEYRVRCQAPPALPGPKADDVIATLKELYDEYGVCAGRVADLLDYIDGGQQ